MTFYEYVQLEFEIVCDIAYKEKKPKIEILHKFNGSIRTLENICNGTEFFKNLNSNPYCSLGSFNNRNIECKYISKKLDDNGNRTCDYSKIKTTEIIEKLKIESNSI